MPYVAWLIVIEANCYSLSHAEVAEDVGQHIGGGDLTDYLGQVGETLSQVLGYEVCAYSVLQALYGAQ